MISLIGVNGIKHKTLDDAKTSWHAGKDFVIEKGPRCNISSVNKLVKAGHAIVLKAGENNELSEIITRGV